MKKISTLILGVIVALLILMLPMEAFGQKNIQDYAERISAKSNSGNLSNVVWVRPSGVEKKDYVVIKRFFETMQNTDRLAPDDVLDKLLQDKSKIPFPKEEGVRYFFLGTQYLVESEGEKSYSVRYLIYLPVMGWMEDHMVVWYFDKKGKLNEGFFFEPKDYVVLGK